MLNEKTTNQMIKSIRRLKGFVLEKYAGNGSIQRKIGDILERFESFLKGPVCEQYLNNIKLVIDIIVRLISVLQSLED